MEHYRLKVISRKNLFLLLLLFIPLSYLASYVTPFSIKLANQLLVISLTILLLVIFYFLLQKTATAITLWTIDRDHIHIQWQTQFFGDSKKDQALPWSELKDITFTAHRSYQKIRIKPANGKTLRLYADRWANDDYKALKACLNQKLKEQTYNLFSFTKPLP